ncbi:MAG: hypothetical protein L6W00_01045 [Lentisphaeria bacterium]|nr:MAG: hypothetical protein L6W00_01045 [Lentisphaeria bacterium]
MNGTGFSWLTAAAPPPAPQNVRLLAVCEWTARETDGTPELEVAAEGWFRISCDGLLIGTTNSRGSNRRFYVETFPLSAAKPGSRHTLALELLSPLKGCYNCVPAGCAFAVRFPAGIETTPWRAVWSEAWRNSPLFFHAADRLHGARRLAGGAAGMAHRDRYAELAARRAVRQSETASETPDPAPGGECTASGCAAAAPRARPCTGTLGGKSGRGTGAVHSLAPPGTVPQLRRPPPARQT